MVPKRPGDGQCQQVRNGGRGVHPAPEALQQLHEAVRVEVPREVEVRDLREAPGRPLGPEATDPGERLAGYGIRRCGLDRRGLWPHLQDVREVDPAARPRTGDALDGDTHLGRGPPGRRGGPYLPAVL